MDNINDLDKELAVLATKRLHELSFLKAFKQVMKYEVNEKKLRV